MFREITIIGNLGGDPEVRNLPSGTIAGNFSVATNDPPYFNKSTGEMVKPDPVWWRVVAYQTGETGLVTNLIQKWLKKGKLVYIKGEPTIRKYTDQQGIQRQAFEIKLGPQSIIKMLGGERDTGSAVTPANGTMPNTEKGDPGNIDLGEIPI